MIEDVANFYACAPRAELRITPMACAPDIPPPRQSLPLTSDGCDRSIFRPDTHDDTRRTATILKSHCCADLGPRSLLVVRSFDATSSARRPAHDARVRQWD